MGDRYNHMDDLVNTLQDGGGVTVRCLKPLRDDLTIVDAYVRQHPDATPYHRSAWLEAVHDAYRFPVSLLVAFDGRRQIIGVLPLCHLSIPLGKVSLVSLPYCDLGGPLANDARGEDALITEARQLATRMGARSLSLRRAGPVLGLEQTMASHKVSMLCQLPGSSEALFQSYKPKLRSQIRKAEKNGLNASVRQDAEALEQFYRVFASNMHRLGSPVHAPGWFRALHSHYRTDLLVGIVSFDGEPVGAGIVLLNGERASIPWASTLSEYNHLAPNMLLYWTLLSYVTDRGVTLFDFGRSSPGEGTYRFKKQWGAVPHELDWVNELKNRPDSATNAEQSPMARMFRTWIESLWRGLPLAVANRLGPLIRKYVSL